MRMLEIKKDMFIDLDRVVAVYVYKPTLDSEEYLSVQLMNGTQAVLFDEKYIPNIGHIMSIITGKK